jgi:hypothetical protein
MGAETYCSRGNKTKLQRLQEQSKVHGDNVNSVKRETSKRFSNKTKDNMKDKIKELATNSKNKKIRDLYRGIN